MSVNTHTYSIIVGISSVHLIGEVWASVLWDLNWALISGNSLDPAIKTTGLGFNADLTSDQSGNNLAMKLVVQALKTTDQPNVLASSRMRFWPLTSF